MVPNGWKLKKLEELTLEKLSYGANSPSCEIKDGGTRYIRITDIDDSGNLNSDTVGIESESYDEYVLKHNDFLFARSGNTVGKTFLYEKDKHPKSAYAGYLIRYRADETKLLPQYLKQYCFSSRYNFWVKSQIRAGAQPNINAKEYGSLELPLPSIQEQRKIANILSTWDKAISTTERLIDNSKQQKKALMQQLLTGAHTQRKRLLDDSGKPFEGEWEEVVLKDLCSNVIDNRGKTPPLSEIGLPLVEINSIVNSKYPKLSKVTKFVSPETFKTWFRNGHPERGDILVATVGSAGISALVNLDKGFGSIAQNLIAIRPNSKADSSFLYYLMNTPYYFSLVRAVVMGAVQPSLKVPHLLSFKMKIPSNSEQQKIASVLSNADKEVELLEQQLADLKQEKKALMQQLLTGKRRVKVDDKEVA